MTARPTQPSGPRSCRGRRAAPDGPPASRAPSPPPARHPPSPLKLVEVASSSSTLTRSPGAPSRRKFTGL